MDIPKKFKKNNKEYTFIKEYPNYVLYKDKLGCKECFKFDELGLAKNNIKIKHEPFKNYIYNGGTND